MEQASHFNVVLPCPLFVFLTLDGYSMIALSNAIEALRFANQAAQQQVFQWKICSLNGAPSVASNGLTMEPTVAVDACSEAGILFVCGGDHIEKKVDQRLIGELKRFDKLQIPLGSICTGSYALAKAGLLDKYRVAVHWEYLPVLAEEFPAVYSGGQIYTIDRNRFTSSGGVASLDLMIRIIQSHLGNKIAGQVLNQVALDRVRGDKDRQRTSRQSADGAIHRSLREVLDLMEANIEEPLSLDEISELVGVSRRQIERLFTQYMGEPPARHYLSLRLRWARSLLLKTSMRTIEIALASGFQTSPQFSKQYRVAFGRSPREERFRHIQGQVALPA